MALNKSNKIKEITKHNCFPCILSPFFLLFQVELGMLMQYFKKRHEVIRMCCIVTTTNNYTYTYAWRNIFNTIKTSRHSFFRKIYFLLYWKGCVWEGAGDRTKTATYWPPPTLLAITAFLSHSPGLLNWGPGDPASAGTWFSFQHLLSNWSELPVAGVI